MFISAWLYLDLPNEQEANESPSYWIGRLEPMINKTSFLKKFGFVFTNRCGTEGKTTYVGSTLHCMLNGKGVAKRCNSSDEQVMISSFDLN